MPARAPDSGRRPGRAYFAHASASVRRCSSLGSISRGSSPLYPRHGACHRQPRLRKEGTAMISASLSFSASYASGCQESAQMRTPSRPAGVSKMGSSSSDPGARYRSSSSMGNAFRTGGSMARPSGP